MILHLPLGSPPLMKAAADFVLMTHIGGAFVGIASGTAALLSVSIVGLSCVHAALGGLEDRRVALAVERNAPHGYVIGAQHVEVAALDEYDRAAGARGGRRAAPERELAQPGPTGARS